MRRWLIALALLGNACGTDSPEDRPAAPRAAPEAPPPGAEPAEAPPDPAFDLASPEAADPCVGDARRSCRLEGGGLRISLDAEGRPVREDWPGRGLTLQYAYAEDGSIARVGLDADGDGRIDHVRVWSGAGDARAVEGRARAGVEAEPPWPLRMCLGDAAEDRRDCVRLQLFSRGGGGFGASRTRYDEGGREIERITDTFANHRATERVTREHDAEGRPVRETKETSTYTLLHTWSYDDAGRCVREEQGTVGHPLRVALHRYDDAGRRTRTVDESGLTLVDRSYDAEGRLVREAWDVGPGDPSAPDGEVGEVLHFAYDAAGALIERTRSWDDGLHREVEHLDAAGTVLRRELFEGRGPPRTLERFELDAEGRPVASTRTERGVVGATRTRTRYDVFGQRVAVETRRPGSSACAVHARSCALEYLSSDAPTDELGATCARACALLLRYER